MYQKSITILFCCFAVFVAGTYIASGQEKEVDLKDQKITIKMEKTPSGLVLDYLREIYDIPIGFERSVLDRGLQERFFSSNAPADGNYRTEIIDGVWKLSDFDNDRKPTNPITIIVENEPLEKVLNSVVKQMENYEWEIRDGVVNIYPINGREPILEKLLSLKVKEFKFEKDQTIWKISETIEKLPEVSEFVKVNSKDDKLEFVAGTLGGNESQLELQHGRKIEEEMQFSNLTFRELLNKITKIKRGAWIMRILQRNGMETILLDI